MHTKANGYCPNNIEATIPIIISDFTKSIDKWVFKCTVYSGDKNRDQDEDDRPKAFATQFHNSINDIPVIASLANKRYFTLVFHPAYHLLV